MKNSRHPPKPLKPKKSSIPIPTTTTQPPPTLPNRIVTSDDFGLSHFVNHATAAAARCGLLTHASLMPGGPAFHHAIHLASQFPSLQIGLHLTLCLGHALTPWTLARHDRTLPLGPARTGIAIWQHRHSHTFRNGLTREIAAQFSAVRNACPTATHWDGHCHLHLHPVIFPIAARLAQEHGFNRTRLLLHPESLSPTALTLCWLSHHALPTALHYHQSTPDKVFGLAHTGRYTADHLIRHLALVDTFPSDQTIELYLHPGIDPGPYPG